MPGHLGTQSVIIPCPCMIPVHLSPAQAAAARAGGGRGRAGQEQRATAETPAEEEPRWPEKSPAPPCPVREQRGERKRIVKRLQLHPRRSSCQKPNSGQGAGQGGPSGCKQMWRVQWDMIQISTQGIDISITVESSQTGDPWPAGRVRGGEKRLPGDHPPAGEGGPAAERPAGTYGSPGAARLQLQQPGPAEERSCLGWGQRHVEAAGRDGAENNTALRCNMWRGGRIEKDSVKDDQV